MCYCTPDIRTPYCHRFICQEEKRKNNGNFVSHCKPVNNTPSIDWEEEKISDNELPSEIKVPSVSTTLPHKCPVCGGRTIVPAGFFTSTSLTWSSSQVTEPCKVCDATGIVWNSNIENI
jgi:hypothetical protein